MRRTLIAVCALLLMLHVRSANASGQGEIVTYGNSPIGGVSATAIHQGFIPKQDSGPEAEAPVPDVSAAANGPVLVVEVTNRCTATNLGGPFEYNFAHGVECASFSAPSPDKPGRANKRRPPPPSPEQIAAALFDRAISLAPDPELEVAPARVGLAGLRSYFWLADSPRPIVATASAGPTSVTAIAVPAEFVWDFGDGAARRTQDAGRAWRPRRTGSIGHMYQTAGRHELSAEIVWQASWRTGEGPWQPLGSFTTSASRTYPVREVIAWLVRRR